MANQAMLPIIPVVNADQTNWCLHLLQQETSKAHALLDKAAERFPDFLMSFGDKRSEQWLEKFNNPFSKEISQVSDFVKRSGAIFLNVSYEWGCTSRAGPDPENKCARLIRILDWPDDGLGSNITALNINGPLGEWTSLTWPGYAGVLQAVAKGRFAAAINQGPMDLTTGFYSLDWAINRFHMWNTPHIPPSHLLRQVFETVETYAEAKQILTDTPIAAPAIFILSGLTPDESCVIERRQEEAYVIEEPVAAANSWRRSDWRGCFRGEENENRITMMGEQACCLENEFSWLKPPVLNDRTRLAMIADASTGELIAQGFEKDGPATQVLKL